MRFIKTILVSLLVVCLSSTVLAQRSGSEGPKPDAPKDVKILAKLGYDTSAELRPNEVRHVCMTVWSDGNYRLIRSTHVGSLDVSERLRGQIPGEDFAPLEKLLTALDFSNRSRQGSLILNDAETFAVDLRGRHSHWLNADGANPFPQSVAKIVDWLQDFNPKGAHAFEQAEFEDVCPSEGYKPLQPSVAENGKP